MITIITICYIGLVYAAFKVIKIKVTAASVAVATVIGVLILGGILIGWTQSAPITQQMVVYRPVIPVLSSQNSKGAIKKIYVKTDQPVKKGDPLYEVESAPFQHTLDQKMAQLAESKNKIRELEAALGVAVSQEAMAKSSRAAEKADYDVEQGIAKDDASAISKLRVERGRLSYLSAQASVDVAKASRASAKFALQSARQALPAIEAEVRTAQLELDRTVIKAPADGYLMNWQGAEGTMTTTVSASAQGAFVDMSETVVVAIFPQNQLKNVHSGDSVDVAFKSFPNQIATGTVDAVLEYTGEGQQLTRGVIPVAASVGSKGKLAVRVALDDAVFAKQLPLGGAGTTAIYTKVGNPFHIITKITMRIKSLLYNLPI
jgi:membrane fusion protein (multidrug efflux system)